MERETKRRLEAYRRNEAGPIENSLIDELANGELDRAEFIRRGAMFGLAATTIGAGLRVFGEAPLARAGVLSPAAGGRLRLGINPPPAKGLDPQPTPTWAASRPAASPGSSSRARRTA